MGSEKRDGDTVDSRDGLEEELSLEGLEEETPEMEPLMDGDADTSRPKSGAAEAHGGGDETGPQAEAEGAETESAEEPADAAPQGDFLDAAGAEDLYEHDYYGTGMEPVPHLFELAEPNTPSQDLPPAEEIDTGAEGMDAEAEPPALPEPPAAEEELDAALGEVRVAAYGPENLPTLWMERAGRAEVRLARTAPR